MADKDSGNDEDLSNVWRRTRRNGDDNTTEDMDASNDNPSGPDIGLGQAQRRSEGQKFGESSTAEGGRREETGSLSFKHFLQSSSTGARPKVYDNPRFEPKENFRRTVNPPELASVLPDFVQDHLVVEQCYLADTTLDIENLPDFALGGSSDLDLPLDLGQREQLPFDLTQLGSSRSPSTSSNDPFRSRYGRPADRVLPLDLAQSTSAGMSGEQLPLDLAQGSHLAAHSPTSSAGRPPSENLPCDLGLGNAQAPLDLGAGVAPVCSDNPVSQALPDFLSDGPIQCGRESSEGLPGPERSDSDRVSTSSGATGLEDSCARVQEAAETERLRRQLTEMTRRCEALEGEVRRCREAAHSREDSLRRANSEVAALRRENSMLRQSGAAAAGSELDPHTQRVARELMAAATHAEHSLRQLLSGVESLRLLASSLDQGGPSPRPHASPRPASSPSSQDYEPQDRAGPAL